MVKDHSQNFLGVFIDFKNVLGCQGGGGTSRWIVFLEQLDNLEDVGFHQDGDLTSLGVIKMYSKIIVGLATRSFHSSSAIFEETHIGLVKPGNHPGDNILGDMGDFQIIHMPDDGELLAVHHLVCNTRVVVCSKGSI